MSAVIQEASQGENLSNCTITVRVIKSFTYRTCKNVILRHLDLNTVTVGELKEMTKNEVHTKPGWKPYQTLSLDTVKLYSKSHGTKTMNLIINIDNDAEYVFYDDSKSLAQVGCEDETEVSIFEGLGYEAFKKDPVQKW